LKFEEGLFFGIDRSRNLTSEPVGSRVGLSDFSIDVGETDFDGNRKLFFSA